MIVNLGNGVPMTAAIPPADFIGADYPFINMRRKILYPAEKGRSDIVGYIFVIIYDVINFTVDIQNA